MSEGNGGMPEGWVEVKLGDVAEHVLGKMLDRKRTAGRPLPYLRNINVRWSAFDLDDLLTMPFQDGELERYGLQPGDVIICEGGEPGRAAVWPGSEDTILFQKALHRVRALDVLDPRWLVFHLQRDAISGALEEYFTGTTIKHFTGSSLARYRVLVPPLPEQRRIVARIEEMQARTQRAREALEGVPALLAQVRQSVLASAFRGDLTADWRESHPNVEPASVLLERIRAERRRQWEDVELEKLRAKGKEPNGNRWKQRYQEPEPVDTSGLPELPEGWAWAAAEELAAPGRPIIYGIIKPGPDTPGGVPYVRVTEMKDGYVDVSALRRCAPARAAKFSRATLRAGDVLVSKDGTIGKVAIVPPELDGGNITQHVLRVSPSEGIRPDYLARAIESPLSQQWMTGELKGIGLQGINVGDFRRMPVPLAPGPEQAVICALLAAELDSVSRQAEVSAGALALLERLGRSILARAFRGELVPQNPNDEPASLLLERIRAERAQERPRGERRGARGPSAEGEV